MVALEFLILLGMEEPSELDGYFLLGTGLIRSFSATSPKIRRLLLSFMLLPIFISEMARSVLSGMTHGSLINRLLSICLPSFIIHGPEAIVSRRRSITTAGSATSSVSPPMKFSCNSLSCGIILKTSPSPTCQTQFLGSLNRLGDTLLPLLTTFSSLEEFPLWNLLSFGEFRSLRKSKFSPGP